MSLLDKVRVFVVCAILEMGLLAGAPIRAEEIQRLFQEMNQPTVAHALPTENDVGNSDDE